VQFVLQFEHVSLLQFNYTCKFHNSSATVPHNAQSVVLYSASGRGSNCIFFLLRHFTAFERVVSTVRYKCGLFCTDTHRKDLVCACLRVFSPFTILKGFRLNLVRGVHKGRMILKWVCNKIRSRGGDFTGLVFLRIGTAGGPLRLRKCTSDGLKSVELFD
jgi:hypothetical protein